MDNIKNDDYYKEKNYQDLTFILKHTDKLRKDEFSKNEVLQDSMMFRLIQTSENTSKLSENFKKENSKILWHAIKGLRNRIVHDYGNVDVTIVYDTIIHDIPKLEKLFSEII